MECPPGYAETEERVSGPSGPRTRFNCVPCDGPCKKECEGVLIDSIAAAQKLTGCTHITGSGIEIQLRHGGSRKCFSFSFCGSVPSHPSLYRRRTTLGITLRVTDLSGVFPHRG